MIYPDNFELKAGFDRIRALLKENCLSPMGSKWLMTCVYDGPKAGRYPVAETRILQLLGLEDYVPSEDYFEISGSLNKIRIEGSFPEVREVFELRRALETVKSILSFFRRKESEKYPVLRSLCGDVKVFPYVLDSADRIIDKKGEIRDNASPKLKEIRNNISAKTSQASRRLSAIMKQAQAEGIVDPDTVASIREGRGVIPVNANEKRRIKGFTGSVTSGKQFTLNRRKKLRLTMR
jgi:DNA mismatch repair protein MutS2